MSFVRILMILLVFPMSVLAGREDVDTARVGVGRLSQASSRMPSGVKTVSVKVNSNAVQDVEDAEIETKDEEYEEIDSVKNSDVSTQQSSEQISNTQQSSSQSSEHSIVSVVENDGGCRDKYRSCMDEFCLLDESQGERCACSDNIEFAKNKLKNILKLQKEADELFTDGVEREKLGAKASLIFKDTADSGVTNSSSNFLAWLNGGEEDEEGEESALGEDYDLGDALYQQASLYCKKYLDKCGSSAEMESTLYSRMIVQDCKSYDSYLSDQKANAESNKRIAESAVRKARLEVFGTTNKYNRGECLLAFRSCVADKGGCGSNFENCLDSKLLDRRSNACENVLDQCMASRDYVLQDWKAEKKSILQEAEKYADKNQRLTCLAKIQNCLEEGCSTSTNSACLTDVNVAAGVCPIITECNDMIPGLQSVINDKLGYLQTKFCENDIDACLQDKCGQDFSKAECVGKKPYEIAALCPQSMFPSCKNAEQFDIIVQSAILQMDFQMLQGCINYFSEQLSKVCGTDMACLPEDPQISSLSELPSTEEEMLALRKQIVANAQSSVDEFFIQFEQDKTVTACQDSQSIEQNKVKGKQSVGSSVFNTAKLLAQMAAENRSIRELDSKIAELAREQDLKTAEQTCLKTYKVEKPNESKSNYSYIHTVSFEPNMRNCHVCRMQQVCEVGGESKASSALKAAAGGLSAGASAGTMISAGWGTAIGGVVGAVGAGILGAKSGGEKEFCQEIESCEDINM